MFVKKIFYKLYLKLIFFSLIFFLSICNLAISEVLTEEEIKYIESQTKDSKNKNMPLDVACANALIILTEHVSAYEPNDYRELKYLERKFLA